MSSRTQQPRSSASRDDLHPYRAVPVPPAPKASSAAAEAVFKANRRRDTAPELALRKALHARGMRFLVDATPPGVSKRRRVDILLRGSRIAVLVHGCFWHCCPKHFVMPASNREWWSTKFKAIKHRDEDTLRMLEQAGWLAVVVWEHEPVEAVADRLAALHVARRADFAPARG
jgi:DNA mismatch endonuclease (patch repair protein)